MMEHTIRVAICGSNVTLAAKVAAEVRPLPNLSIDSYRWISSQSTEVEYTKTLKTAKYDLCLFCLGENWQSELAQIRNIPFYLRPTQLWLMFDATQSTQPDERQAMQSGALDLFSIPTEKDRLLEAAVRYQRAFDLEEHGGKRITIVMSAVGGGGASTVAAGLAHAMSKRFALKTLLVDLDLQFGTQYILHDLDPEKGLKEAFDNLNDLDPIALKTYTSHGSVPFDLIGVTPSQLLLDQDIPSGVLKKLIDLARPQYDHILVDLPSRMGVLTAQALTMATDLLLVVRQDVCSVRKAQQMVDIFLNEFEYSKERVGYVISQYQSKNPIQQEDISDALGIPCLGVLADEVDLVRKAETLARPIADHAPNSSLARTFSKIAVAISEVDESLLTPSVMSRLFSKVKLS